MTAKMLSDLGVRAVIICNEMSHSAEEELFNLNVPVLKAEDVNLQLGHAEDFAVIEPGDIEHAIDEWNKEAEKRRIAAKEKWLESLVDEYRSDRWRRVKERQRAYANYLSALSQRQRTLCVRYICFHDNHSIEC